jgi:hypothetical protein
MPENTRRSWLDLVPDIRGWATLGMFALVFYILHLIATVPGIDKSDLFKTAATLLLGSGAFGLACSFIWGGSKATVSAIDTVNAVAKQAGGAMPPPAPAPAPVAPTVQPDPASGAGQ